MLWLKILVKNDKKPKVAGQSQLENQHKADESVIVRISVNPTNAETMKVGTLREGQPSDGATATFRRSARCSQR